MNPALLIRVGLAIGAVIGAAVLGRKAIDKTIERRMSAATEEAVRLAEEELDRSVQSVMQERIGAFLRTMAWKFLLLGLVCAGYGLGLITLSGLRFGVVALGLGYLAYDLTSALPKVLPALRYARRHRFSPRTMVTNAVAASAFEQAYATAARKLGEKDGKRWIALSSFNPHDLSNEIAGAVAEVARGVSYDQVKPRALLFVALTTVLSLCYTGLAWLVIQL